jgi:hypothetical protein
MSTFCPCSRLVLTPPPPTRSLILFTENSHPVTFPAGNYICCCVSELSAFRHSRFTAVKVAEVTRPSRVTAAVRVCQTLCLGEVLRVKSGSVVLSRMCRTNT